MPIQDVPKWHRYLRFWRTNVQDDVDTEILFHVDERARELIVAGVAPLQARAQALREFGDLERARTLLRTIDEAHLAGAHRAELFADAWQDARVAARSLARSPGFSAIVILTLALGIGLNSAVYSLVDAFMFRPMDVEHGKELVILAQTDAALSAPHELSFPNFQDYRSDTTIFRDLAAYAVNNMSLSGGRGAERVWVEEATANHFRVLGVHPLLGRLFEPGDDDGELTHPEIVLSYKFWQSHFGGDPNVVGDTIRLNNHPMHIIGVTPPTFHGADALLDIDAFAPLNQTWPTYGASLHDRSGTGFNVIGLLRPGLSLAAARAAVRGKAKLLEREYPDVNRDVGAVIVPQTHARPNITVSTNVPVIAAAFMLLVLLVLAIACANVASLLLARATAQHKEQALRAALGASRWRLARRVVIECLMLAAAGGAGAILLANAAVSALRNVKIAADVPIRWDITVDKRVMAFTLLIVLLTALFAAVAPVLGVRKTNLADALRDGERSSGGVAHQRMRGVLVVAQIAVCVVIVVCAALFARSTANAFRINVGFRTDHIFMASAQLGIQGYDSIRGKRFEREVLDRVAQLPGVRSVALQRYTPFGYNNDIEYVVPEVTTAKIPENGIGCFNNVVTPTYFATFGIPIVEGRGFTAQDDDHAPQVAVVTRRFAERVWPGQSAIGKRFKIAGDGPTVGVVGVAGDIQYFSIGETPKPFYFRPYAQSYRSSFTLVIHTAVDPVSLTAPVRSAIAALDPTLPIFDVRSFDDHILNGRALLGTRLGAWFAGVFGALALILASVGVYGLVSYSVVQRRREIGIRVALGARTATVVSLVVRQGVRIAIVGVVIGLLMTIGVAQLLSKLLYGVAPNDPVILIGVGLTLAGVGAAASIVPARRAATVDVVDALRG